MQIELDSKEIAARVTEIELRAGLSDAEWNEIERLWNRHHLLVFPDQRDLSVEDQVGLLERFGPVLEERVPGEKHSYVSNALGKGTDEMNSGYREGELTPHMDFTYTPFPADVISLYATELPESGSKTLFYSNVAPLARMPATLRSELERYTLFCAHDLSSMKPDARLYEEGRTRPDAPTQSHTWPMLRSHPRKPGVEVLFCTLQQTERVIELSDESMRDRESFELLDRVFNQYLYVPENEYEHDWTLGDLVVWDNLALQHARRECPVTAGRRTFRRVSVCEAGNAIHETVAFLNLKDSSVAFS